MAILTSTHSWLTQGLVVVTTASVTALACFVWKDYASQSACWDEMHMTCNTTDEDRTCRPGATATLREDVRVGGLSEGKCLVTLCHCVPPSSSARVDAGPPDVSQPQASEPDAGAD